MNKFILTGATVLLGVSAYAQSAVDAYRLSQPDLKGTARYMSMGGAFGALGGDLSSISHNPAGIGVYRNSDIGFTLDLDLQNSKSTSNIGSSTVNQTKFLLNNAGIVWTLKLPSASVPNLNFGFTYNKNVSFNRRYRGQIRLNNSLSNFIATNSTLSGYQPDMLVDDYNSDYDPYSPDAGNIDWLSILGYNGFLFSNNYASPNQPDYVGLWGSNTTGTGWFDVVESGGIDSYNIAIGGNIANVVFWGMDFDITHMNYNLTPIWEEDLQNAVVGNDYGDFAMKPAYFNLQNFYNCSGTGFNYKLGIIVKPIQELRLGFAFETPTWYTLTESFRANLYSDFYNADDDTYDVYERTTNGGWTGYNDVNFKTPWKINASAAAVLFNKLIISGEYEWTKYKGMKYSTPTYWGDDYYGYDYPPYDPYYDPYISYDAFAQTNSEIKEYYRNTNTLRLGAEFRVTPQLSVRAGYSLVSSPVETKTKNSEVVTVGTIPNYRLDNTTNYITCGLGYKIQNFSIDLAYVYKHMTSEYNAFSPIYEDVNSGPLIVEPQKASLSFNNSQIVLSAGFKF